MEDANVEPHTCSRIVNIALYFKRPTLTYVLYLHLEVAHSPFAQAQVSRFSIIWPFTGSNDGSRVLLHSFVRNIKSEHTSSIRDLALVEGIICL